MISLAPGTKVFLACRPIDLRSGFNGLAAKAQQVIGQDPFSGHLFLFRGKRGDYFKAIYWDGSGLCTCPECGRGMSKLGEDITEVLDYVPGHFQVIRHVRPKYACAACDAITQAPAPAMRTPRGRATPGLLSHLLVGKYCDHLPLYRQAEIYAREGLDLDRSTLCDWIGQAAWLLDPVVAGIQRHVFAAAKIHGDDTTVPVLMPGLGRTKTGRLWVYVRDDRPFCGDAPPAAAYFYSPDRGGERPAAHIAGFTGFLQADGYSGFQAMYHPARTKPGPIIEVACWAHCRRKIFDVWEQTKSPVAKEALDRIAAFYLIEEIARFAPAAERVEHRKQTASLLEAFFTWAEATVPKLSAKSALAEALRYILKRREALTRFVTDGRLEAGGVDDRRGGCSLPAGCWWRFRPTPSARAGLAPFPVAAHRTGHAELPHPAPSPSFRT